MSSARTSVSAHEGKPLRGTHISSAPHSSVPLEVLQKDAVQVLGSRFRRAPGDEEGAEVGVGQEVLALCARGLARQGQLGRARGTRRTRRRTSSRTCPSSRMREQTLEMLEAVGKGAALQCASSHSAEARQAATSSRTVERCRIAESCTGAARVAAAGLSLCAQRACTRERAGAGEKRHQLPRRLSGSQGPKVRAGGCRPGLRCPRGVDEPASAATSFHRGCRPG